MSVYYVSIFTYQKGSYDFRYFKGRNCKNYVLGYIGRAKHLIRLLIRTILFVHEHTVHTIFFISLGRLDPYKFDNYLRFEIFCFWPSQTWIVYLWMTIISFPYYSNMSFRKLTTVLYPCGTQVILKGRIKVSVFEGQAVGVFTAKQQYAQKCHFRTFHTTVLTESTVIKPKPTSI